jgi:FAD:protein FMN transferase
MKYLVILFLNVFFVSCSSTQETIDLCGETMGTTYSIKIADGRMSNDKKGVLKSEIDSLLQNVNMQMSTYIPESAISVFNKKRAGEWQEVSADFLKVLNLARQVNIESGGAFDVTVAPVVDLWGFGKKEDRNSPPSEEEVDHLKELVGMDKIVIDGKRIMKNHDKTELDFSAIAKGFGVDAVAEYLAGQGFKNYLVEIGGEVVVKGAKHGEPWRIGVDRPLIEPTVNHQFQAILKIKDVAVATSGDYRNYFVSGDSLYSHTMDPRTCRPIINGVASVTVIAPNCTLADAMATAIMVMGMEKGLHWVESKPDIEVMIIERVGADFNVSESGGFWAFVEETVQ